MGTAAVILPWHDPLWVAEQVAILDFLSDGRLRFGMGRGLARRWLKGFAYLWTNLGKGLMNQQK